MDLIEAVHQDVWAVAMDVWGSKRLTYWSTFQEAITACTYTDSLASFLTRLARRMSLPTLGTNEARRRLIERIVTAGEDRALLRCLRVETALVIVLVRRRAERRRQDWTIRPVEPDSPDDRALFEEGNDGG